MTSSPVKTTGVMICGHGSRDPGAVSEFKNLSVKLTERLPQYHVDYGFLEFASPVIHDGFEALKAKGVTRVLALPGMLFAAGHVKNDVPSEVNEFARANPGIQVDMARELGIDPKLLNASVDRIELAENLAPEKIDRKGTCLVVVGRGTNDPDANSNVAKVTRMLWESLGYGWAETAYSGVTTPLVDACLDRVAKLGFKRVVVFPYFLFTGILVQRIYDWTDAAAEKFPEIDFVKAGYLNDHPLVIESFAERVQDILDGKTAMNCQLCKYREQIVGFEGVVGQAQAGHHHHVRGIGTDDDHGHHHHHHHGHGHHHHHDH